jgi:hypothetical protein
MDDYTRMVEALRAEKIGPDEVLNIFGDRAAKQAAALIPHPAANNLRQQSVRLWQAADSIAKGELVG